MPGGASRVFYLAHLPWKSAESMPGGAMMVPPSTELPRKCGRWGVCGILSCPPSMEIGGKHARWCNDGTTFHGTAAKVWQVGGAVVSFLVHLPWKSAESMPGGAMDVPPSTELPRTCGRWGVCGILSCPPSMEIG